MKRAVTVFSIVAVLGFGFMVAVQAQEKAPEVVILKGNPMGGVKFNHTAHATKTGDKCDTCHHASQAAKPLKTPHQKCQDCHTKAVAAPMKTTSRLAFHDAMAKAGTCIGCHAKEAAAGKKAPLKCVECHQKANG
ncbi:MAG: Cytochrome c, class conserved region [Acidobacteria bacterium]|nr:Cytochrome c, class conserved region [Acidobacteriota bacterium]